MLGSMRVLRKGCFSGIWSCNTQETEAHTYFADAVHLCFHSAWNAKEPCGKLCMGPPRGTIELGFGTVELCSTSGSCTEGRATTDLARPDNEALLAAALAVVVATGGVSANV